MNDRDDVHFFPAALALVLVDVGAERERQNKLRDEGRFPFTAADAGLTHTERLPMLIEESGEIAAAVQRLPSSGLMPVNHNDEFDAYRAGDFDTNNGTLAGQVQPRHRGTVDELRAELVQLAAIAVAWVEAIDSGYGVTKPVSDTARTAPPTR